MRLHTRLVATLAFATAFLPAAHAARETLVEAGLRTQTLHLGNHAEPKDFDPNICDAYTDYNILIGLYEGLTVIDEASSKPIPAIASRWEISPDGLVYTFHLRTDAKWSNGDPVTAGDFAYSFARILSPQIVSTYAAMLYPIKNAEAYNTGKIKDESALGIRVINPTTLELTLHQPCPHLLALASHHTWFPVHPPTVEKHGGHRKPHTAWTRPENIVTNGAFTLESWSPNQNVTLRRNPLYYDDAKTRLNRIVFYPIDNTSTEEAAFRSGQLHLTYEVLPDRIESWRKKSPEQIRVDPLLETWFLRFNTTRPPFENPLVRRALSRAIDRDALCRAILRSSRAPAHCLTPPNTAGYTSTAHVPSDFAEARRLLAEAGFPEGKGLPTLEIQFNSDPTNQKLLEAIQQMWRRELGVSATLAGMDQTVYLNNQDRLDYVVSRSRWIGDYNDPTTYLELFLSNNPNNRTGWKNPRYDELYEKALLTLDPTARFALFDQAEKLLIDEAPIAPVFFGARTYLIHPSVKGWIPSLLGIHRYQKIWLE